jgi:hypothetical protein
MGASLSEVAAHRDKKGREKAAWASQVGEKQPIALDAVR